MPPSAEARLSRRLKPVRDDFSPAWWGSRVRISRTRAPSKTKRWKETLEGSGGSKVCGR